MIFEPGGRVGDSIGNVQWFYFLIVPAVWWKYQGFIFWVKMAVRVGENGSGYTNWMSPQCGAFIRDWLDGKSKSQLFPEAGGSMVTNDWCIVSKQRTINEVICLSSIAADMCV